MFHQRNMRESTHTGDTPQARFLLEKNRIHSSIAQSVERRTVNSAETVPY